MVKPKAAKRASGNADKRLILDENIVFVLNAYPYLPAVTKAALYAGLGFPFILVEILIEHAIDEENIGGLSGLREDEKLETSEVLGSLEVEEIDFKTVARAYRHGGVPVEPESMEAWKLDDAEFQRANEGPVGYELRKPRPGKYEWVWKVFGNPRDNVGDLLRCLDGLIAEIPALADSRIKETIIGILKRIKRLTSPSMVPTSGAVCAAYMMVASNSLLVCDIFGVVHWLERPKDAESLAWINMLWQKGLNTNEMPSWLIPIADIEVDGVTEELKNEIITAEYQTVGSLLHRGRSVLYEVPHLDEEKLEAIRAYGVVETERRRAVWPIVVEAVTSVCKRLIFQDYPIDEKVFVPIMSITLMLNMGPDHTLKEYADETERLFFEDPNLLDALIKNMRGLMAQAVVKYRREGLPIEIQVPSGSDWMKAASIVSAEYPLGMCTHDSNAYKLVITPMSLREWLEVNLSDKEIKFVNEYYGYVDKNNKRTNDLIKFYGKEEVEKTVHGLLGRVCHVKEGSLMHFYQTYEGKPEHISTAVAEPEMAWDFCKVATEMWIAELKDKLAILKGEKAAVPREVKEMTEEKKQEEIAKVEAKLAKINPKKKLDPKAAIEDMDVPLEVREYIKSHPECEVKQNEVKNYKPIPILVRRDVPMGWWCDAARSIMIFRFEADEKRFKLVKLVK